MPTKPRTNRQARRLPAAYDRQRGSASARGYDARWQRVRARQLRREPLCRHCAERGITTPATEVDHIRPLRVGGARLDPANLQSLCKSCHSRKTAAERRDM